MSVLLATGWESKQAAIAMLRLGSWRRTWVQAAVRLAGFGVIYKSWHGAGGSKSLLSMWCNSGLDAIDGSRLFFYVYVCARKNLNLQKEVLSRLYLRFDGCL